MDTKNNFVLPKHISLQKARRMNNGLDIDDPRLEALLLPSLRGSTRVFPPAYYEHQERKKRVAELMGTPTT